MTTKDVLSQLSPESLQKLRTFVRNGFVEPLPLPVPPVHEPGSGAVLGDGALAAPLPVAVVHRPSLHLDVVGVLYWLLFVFGVPVVLCLAWWGGG